MKQVNLLKTIPYALVLTLPLFLTSCDSMGDMFNDSSTVSNYDYDHDYKKSTTNVTTYPKSTSAAKVAGASVVEQETARSTTKVITSPKSANTTSNSVPLAGPSVPSMAPTVSQ